MDRHEADLLQEAQEGSRAAREEYLHIHRSFARRMACLWAKRPLEWGEDDELSIALMALDEAIDRYDPQRGASFCTFAGQVIRSRLADHWRRERNERQDVPLDAPEARAGAARAAAGEHRRAERAWERGEELHKFEAQLHEYGLDLTALENASPTHRRRRRRLKRTAEVLARNQKLLQRLLDAKMIPQSDLAQRAGVNEKFLQRGRPYIIALALIMAEPTYAHLRSFLRLPFTGKGEIEI